MTLWRVHDRCCARDASQYHSEGAFIALRVPMGRVEGPAEGRALPTVYHRLRRSGRSPALPYPPSRHCQSTSHGANGQAPHRYPQRDKRIPSKEPRRSLCEDRKNGHAPAATGLFSLAGWAVISWVVTSCATHRAVRDVQHGKIIAGDGVYETGAQ